MTQFSNDFIVVISAVGGVVGLIYATVQIVKGRAKYTEVTQCEAISHEVKSMVEKEAERRHLEDGFLHEKINAVSSRVSKIEGGLDYEKAHVRSK